MDKNRFENLEATIDIQRSTFTKPYTHDSTCKLGEVIPFMYEEVLPGSTYKINTSSVIRTGTLIAPIMTPLFADIYYFFVPNRIIWNHWKQFMGENDISAWTQTTEYTIPTVSLDTSTNEMISGTSLFNRITGCTLANPNGDYLEINELPLRGYYEICNTWFRNENTKAPTLYSKDDNTNTNISYLDQPYTANKFRDYYTSALPSPQKGDAVSLGLLGTAPLKTGEVYSPGAIKLGSGYMTGDATTTPVHTLGISYSAKNNLSLYANDNSTTATNTRFAEDPDSQVDSINLYADLESATAATINQLRFAFQLQKFYEKGALYGTRYQETLKGMFGVNASSARLDIPEYLTGERIRLNIDQVVATAQTGQNESVQIPQGNVAGWSCTGNYNEGFTKSFEEHGAIFGILVIRQENMYSNAIEKTFFRKNKLDYYFPVFANIGNQPIYKKEINPSKYAETTEIFGYQEAWAEYRYKPNKCSGLINPNAANSLNYWNLANDDADSPTVINSNFTNATYKNLDRALAVTSKASGAQFVFSIRSEITATLPMPLFSIPGLIDHH